MCHISPGGWQTLADHRIPQGVGGTLLIIIHKFVFLHLDLSSGTSIAAKVTVVCHDKLFRLTKKKCNNDKFSRDCHSLKVTEIVPWPLTRLPPLPTEP